MREIKFRALGIKNNWMFGYLIKQGAYYFIQNDKGGNDVAIQNTIGQFTGLTDKNGVEIYEGDICKVTYFNHSSPNTVIIQEVTFSNGTFELKSKNHMDMNLEDSRQYVPLFYCFAPNKIEVIGNIHQNPELLK